MTVSNNINERSPIASTGQAAQFLQLKEQTLRAWACKQSGPIQPIRIGNRLRWRWADLQALIGSEVA